MMGNNIVLPPDASAARVGRIRWIIAGLLFLETILNYVDYMSLAVLAPRIIENLGMRDKDFANIVMSFQISFTVMFLVGGFIIDRIGVRWGMALALGWWSVAQMAHAYARDATDLIVLRALFGLAYPAAYICAAKVVSQWFPPRERAFVTGIYTAGATVGATLSPIIIGRMYEAYNSWRPPFFLFGALGIAYVIIWLLLYKAPENSRLLTASERNYILSGREQVPTQIIPQGPRTEPAVMQILKYRYFWVISLGRLIGDNPWGFYTSFVPLFLDRRFGMTTAEFAAIGWLPFLFSDFGSLGGGWLSGWLIRRGWPVLRARLAIMLVCACITAFTFTMGLASTTTMIIALLCLFMFSIMAWMVNLSTIPNDTFPEHLVGRAVGMTTTAAALGQLVLTTFFIKPLIDSQRYMTLFVVMSFSAPLAYIIVQALRPKPDPRVPDKGTRPAIT
jgi:MFS transporter, ACS family, hexuronate transporter